MGQYLRKLCENAAKTVRKLYGKCTRTVRKVYEYMWSPPKLPRKMRLRNILVIFLLKNDQKSLKIWPGRHVQNLGVAFFLKKTAGGSLPRSTWVFCPAKSRMACMAWLLGKDQSWQNMVLVLIGLHMAPNGVLTGSLSRKFRGGSPDRHQIQPSCQKWIEIFRDLGRVGSGFCGFSGFFSE